MNEIATTAAAVARRAALTAEQIEQATEKPLRLVPVAEMRIPAWGFWATWSHLLPTQLVIAMRLRRWIEDEGLTLAEAEEAFERVNAPERAARIKYAGELIATLAEQVALVIGRRKGRDEMLTRRTDLGGKLPAEELAAMKEKLAAGWAAGGG